MDGSATGTDAGTGGAGAVLTIDLDAIARNYDRLRRLAGPAAVAAVGKADGYGLGSGAVAARLAAAGCTEFFVAHLGEVPAVIAAAPRAMAVYVLNGIQPGAEAACVAAGAVPVLNTLAEVARWRDAAARAGRRLRAAIQIDSGMARLGLSADEVERLAADPALLDGIEPVLVMSHLACADTPAHPANTAQRVAFDRLSARLPAVRRSLANSGGILLGAPWHYDLVRPGIALYGGNPRDAAPNPVEPVVTLIAPVIRVRDVPAGAGIGYGLTDAVDRPRRIAAISVGYADGWPRHLGQRGGAFVAGTRVPIAGRVSMDSLLLDVTEIDVQTGDPVELLGPHQLIDDVARDAGTIAYEVLTRLGHRYARRLVGGVAAARRHAA